jgi:hypothetical protein
LLNVDDTEDSWNNALKTLMEIGRELLTKDTPKLVNGWSGISDSSKYDVTIAINDARKKIKGKILTKYEKSKSETSWDFSKIIDYYTFDDETGMKPLGKFMNEEIDYSDITDQGREEAPRIFFFDKHDGGISNKYNNGFYTKKQSDTGGRKTTKQNYFRKTRRIGKTNRVPKKTRTNGSRNRIRKPRGVISQTNRKSRKH